MLFANTPRSRKSKARLASACGRTIEAMESRRLLSVSGLDITAITSAADSDSGAGGAEHVTVIAGSMVEVDFRYATDGGLAKTNWHAEIWTSDFSGNALKTTAENDASSDADGLHTGSIELDTTGLAAGEYGVKVSVTHKGNDSDSDPNPSETASGITIIRLVNIVSTTTTVVAPDAIYDGNQHGATATATAAGTIAFSYSGTGATDYPLTDIAPTNAGTYEVVATFTPENPAAYAASSSSASFLIAKADATVVVSGYTGGTYDGDEHTQTVTVTGVGSDGVLFTDSLAGTNADSYSKDWSFSDSNYNDAQGTLAFAIAKADATVTVDSYSGIYDGDSHTATVTITGVGGVVLASNSVSRTNAGSDSASTSISDSLNYNNASGTATIAIAKADATIVVNGYSGKYDGDSHGASGSATGVLGEDLSSALNLGASFTNCPGGTASWSFTDVTGNYNDAFGDVGIVIDKADLTGIARTQDALNIAKQGTLTIDLSSIKGFVGADTVASVFSTAKFTLTIGETNYTFDPTVSIDVLTNTVHVAYTLRGGTTAGDLLRADLAALDVIDGGASTSASKTPYSTMWIVAESANYTFTDDFLTRLFCSAK